jgi:EAL domain-containing protein (putative c-di-GMP-specific phosphodiesterase class I)
MVELLYRGPQFPRSLSEWRPWYEKLPQRLERIFEKYDLQAISVNINSDQILDAEIMASIASIRDFPVILEWTEHRNDNIQLMEIMRAGEILSDIRSKHGMQIALDDVFSGEDAFRRMCAIGPDMVKLDLEVFQLTRTNPRIFELLRHKVLAHKKTNILTVVEGIETEKDLEVAFAIGAEMGQGFFWDNSAIVKHSEEQSARYA